MPPGVIYRKVPKFDVEPEAGIDAPEVGHGLGGRHTKEENAANEKHGWRHDANIDFHRQVKVQAKEMGK